MMTGVLVGLCYAVLCIAILFLLLDMLKIKKKYIVLIFVFIAGVAVITNPRIDQHAQCVVKMSIDRTGNDYNNIAGSLAISMANNLVLNMVEVDNYLLFSFTKIKSKIVGIGAFGNVWIFER
jgi:hypothetical protein